MGKSGEVIGIYIGKVDLVENTYENEKTGSDFWYMHKYYGKIYQIRKWEELKTVTVIG